MKQQKIKQWNKQAKEEKKRNNNETSKNNLKKTYTQEKQQ